MDGRLLLIQELVLGIYPPVASALPTPVCYLAVFAHAPMDCILIVAYRNERERAEVCCLCNDSPGLGALAFAARKTALPLYQINVTWTKTLRKA